MAMKTARETAHAQPARTPRDGAVGVKRDDGDGVYIEVVTDGVTQNMHVTGFNAWRLLGMLALLLGGADLGKKLGKGIKL